jgi:hypothetical protein
VRFRQNTSYAGVNYGPDYQAKEAEVREDWARYFVRRGRAEYVRASEAPETRPDPSPPEVEPDDLPADFPGRDDLVRAGVTTLTELAAVESLTDIPGIGPATARRIIAARGALGAA